MKEEEKSLLYFPVTTSKLNFQVLGFKDQQENVNRELATNRRTNKKPVNSHPHIMKIPKQHIQQVQIFRI